MRKLAPLRTSPMTDHALIDHSTVLGMVECLDGDMTASDIAEIFDQASNRRDADERGFLMDRHVRRFLADLLRARLPRHKREAVAT
jgi:hypothetical protein